MYKFPTIFYVCTLWKPQKSSSTSSQTMKALHPPRALWPSERFKFQNKFFFPVPAFPLPPSQWPGHGGTFVTASLSNA